MTSLIDFPATLFPCNTVMEVTPEQAARWLEGNTKNRPLNQSHVERFAADMLAGRWLVSHQGIAFDTSRLLLDGQHRLWAVIEAGIPVKLRVFFNQPPETRAVLDLCKRRSNLDVMILGGQVGHVNNRHLATLRAMLAGQSAKANTLSPGAEAEHFSRHRSAVVFAVNHLERGGLQGLCTAQVRAVVARAYYSVDQVRLVHFCDVLKSGVPSDGKDYVVLALRDFLSRSNSAGYGDSIQRVRYAKTQWALRAYAEGRVVKKLCASEGELFLLPSEVTSQSKSA